METLIRRQATIGFTGAGGTGKTTTAKWIAENLSIPFLPSASRVVYEEQSLTEDLVNTWDADKKWELQRNIFDKKIEQDDTTGSFVADRTLLDHWAYCLMYCALDLDKKTFSTMENTVRKHMLSTYTNILYFPWGYWEGESDGVRQDNPAWQSAIDAILVGYCIRWRLPVVEVPQTKGPEIRHEFIKNNLLGVKGMED